MGSLNRSVVEAMPEARVFLAASYLDVAEAEADFEALRRLYVDLGEAAGFDAVTIGRKASGEVRFHREPDRPPGSDADEHIAPSLAAGLAAALFPSVAADSPVGPNALARAMPPPSSSNRYSSNRINYCH